MYFLFQIHPQQAQGLTDQVSGALKARGELVSRRDFPKLWSITDKLNESNKHNKPRSRTWKTVRSILLLLLGVFLFVPGVMKPGELTGPLVVGALSLVVGIAGLLPKGKKKKDRYVEAAEKLLADRASPALEGCRVEFDGEGMTISAGDTAERVEYGQFECVVEAADLYLLVFKERAMLLWKSELTEGDGAAFLPALAAKGVSA